MIDIKPMVDANILVYAHNQDSPFYPRASSLLTELMTNSGFYINILVLQEFFAVITGGRKIEHPLTSKNALAIIDDYINSKVIDILPADDAVFFTWLQNLNVSLKRYEIYDAFIAHTMHRNEVKQLYTNNIKDFKKYDFIQSINPFINSRTTNSASLTTDHSFIPYGKQSINEHDAASVCSVLRSAFITQGPKVPEFEKSVANKVGAKNSVAVNSATSALHLACKALDLGPGDTLWTSPITFVASANCGLYCGAEVGFVDIDPGTYNMSVSCLEAKLVEAQKTGKLPKVVIPVHMCGQSCDMKAIHILSQEYGFSVIEDASHAIGGLYLGEPIGSCRYSDITVFSFHPVKIITTGEGGMAVTNSEDLAKRMELLRSHGITRNQKSDVRHPTTDHGPWYYEQIDLGHNYRMTDIQAALGISQLEKLDVFVKRRRELARRYDRLLADLPLTTPWQHTDNDSAWHLYVIRLKLEGIDSSRREIFEYMRKQGIGVNVHYIPVHTQPYYRRMGFDWGMFPEAEKYYQEAITLPLFQGMTEAEQDRVVEAIKRILPTEHTEGH